MNKLADAEAVLREMYPLDRGDALLSGPEMWLRCWEREDEIERQGRIRQNHKASEHPFADDLHEVQRTGRKVRAYAMLRYQAAMMGRQEGWAAHFYKSIWGDWPPWEWRVVPPMRPLGALKRLIEKRDRKWIKEQKIKEWREDKIANAERAKSTEISNEEGRDD